MHTRNPPFLILIGALLLLPFAEANFGQSGGWQSQGPTCTLEALSFAAYGAFYLNDPIFLGDFETGDLGNWPLSNP